MVRSINEFIESHKGEDGKKGFGNSLRTWACGQKREAAQPKWSNSGLYPPDAGNEDDYAARAANAIKAIQQARYQEIKRPPAQHGEIEIDKRYLDWKQYDMVATGSGGNVRDIKSRLQTLNGYLTQIEGGRTFLGHFVREKTFKIAATLDVLAAAKAKLVGHLNEAGADVERLSAEIAFIDGVMEQAERLKELIKHSQSGASLTG